MEDSDSQPSVTFLSSNTLFIPKSNPSPNAAHPSPQRLEKEPVKPLYLDKLAEKARKRLYIDSYKVFKDLHRVLKTALNNSSAPEEVLYLLIHACNTFFRETAS